MIGGFGFLVNPKDDDEPATVWALVGLVDTVGLRHHAELPAVSAGWHEWLVDTITAEVSIHHLTFPFRVLMSRSVSILLSWRKIPSFLSQMWTFRHLSQKPTSPSHQSELPQLKQTNIFSTSLRDGVCWNACGGVWWHFASV